jgi:FkbM family methyltransferase
MITTYKLWSLKRWTRFWFTNRENIIPLTNYKFNIRSKKIFSKISDISMLYEVIICNEYGEYNIRPKDTVIDIGAHIGGFSIMASKKANPGLVYSFEPFISTFEILKKNKEINDCHNLKIFNIAVGKETKESFMYIKDNNFAENSLCKKTNKKMPIKITTLAKIFKDNKIKKCNLLKIDCEGAEYEILMNAKNELKLIDNIILEYHEPKCFGITEPNYTPANLISFLKENNFDVKAKKVNYYQGKIFAQKKNKNNLKK